MKEVDRGYRAWQRGALDEAIERLERLHDEATPLPEAAFPLARALHERGDSERALEILDGVLELPGIAPGACMHRVLVLWDLERHDRLAADLERLGPDNHLRSALECLTAAREKPLVLEEFPGFALWNSEMVGRLLALQEERFAERTPSAEDHFHHALFALPADALPGTRELRGGDFKAPRDWIAAVESAFTRREFREVLRLDDIDGLDDSWRRSATRAAVAFSAYAELAPAAAVRRAIRAAGDDVDYDLWFLIGLAELRAGNRARAGHAFARSARTADVQIHEVLAALTAHLEAPATPPPDA